MDYGGGARLENVVPMWGQDPWAFGVAWTPAHRELRARTLDKRSGLGIFRALSVFSCD
jgi:hypothetical protein